MTRPATASLAALLIAVGVLLTVWVISSYVFQVTHSGHPNPWAVLTWVGFGGVVAAVGNLAPRRVAIGAAMVVGVVAIADLVNWLPFSGAAPGVISSSVYTWIGMTILAVNGMTRADG